MSKFKYKIVSAANPLPNFNNSNNQSGIFTPNEFRLQTTTGFEYWKYPVPVNQAEFTTPGTYTWTAPNKVFSVCVVCVGGGGGGAADEGGGQEPGGGGGGLGWKNNIPVIPGTQYTVVVGAGAPSLFIPSSTSVLYPANGQDSYFISPTLVKGGGGTSASSKANVAVPGGTFVGDGGGNGGSGGFSGTNVGDYGFAGGGGAGGYTGNGGSFNTSGGAGPPGQAGQGGGGGAGGSHYIGFNNTRGCGGGGGGVGIYGQGASGAGGAGEGGGGFGGSGGANGTTGGGGTSPGKGTGGLFGGGGGGINTSESFQSPPGGRGAVRIIWGEGREFPATNTADV